jgi:hypothetical protein
MSIDESLFEGAPRSLAFVHALRGEVPSLRVVAKATDPFSRAIDRALRVVTLGGQREYIDRYTTVIGTTLYFPTSWNARSDVDRLITLRHEAVHLRQFARLGRPLMSLVYLVPIMPMGLAIGRARIEWEAYRETLRATAELRGMDAARDPVLHAHIVRQFTSAAYGFMWPFPRHVQRWIDEAVAELERGP